MNTNLSEELQKDLIASVKAQLSGQTMFNQIHVQASRFLWSSFGEISIRMDEPNELIGHDPEILIHPHEMDQYFDFSYLKDWIKLPAITGPGRYCQLNWEEVVPGAQHGLPQSWCLQLSPDAHESIKLGGQMYDRRFVWLASKLPNVLGSSLGVFLAFKFDGGRGIVAPQKEVPVNVKLVKLTEDSFAEPLDKPKSVELLADEAKERFLTLKRILDRFED